MIDRSAFRTLSCGLYVVTSLDAGRKFGCIVNTFQQVTSTPARVSVALNKENATTQAVLNSGRYAVTVLAEDATMDLIGTFGFRNSLEVDKFAGLSYTEDGAGVPCVAEQGVARFSMRVIETLDVGTHFMFIGEVEEAELMGEAKPMTYAYYHEVKRGKTPRRASSYIPKDETKDEVKPEAAPQTENVSESETTNGTSSESPVVKKYAWQCSICGHIEYLDELPKDYECPLCGMGAEHFERVEE